MKVLILLSCLLVGLCVGAIPEKAASHIEGKFVARINGQPFERIHEISEIINHQFDSHFSRDSVDVLVDSDTFRRLKDLNFDIVQLGNQPEMMLKWLQANSPADNPLLEYHDYNELTEFLELYHARYPNLTEIFTLGKSVSGRELWGIRISDNIGIREMDEPEFVFIGNIHGDETVGREMIINLIAHLTDNYGSDAEVTELVQTTDIYLIPSVNPDGFERARRANDNGYDLNRDFPDQYTDPNNSPTGRQIETRNMMAFFEAHNFVLGANLHGGTLCANYPYDGLTNQAQCGRAISYSPDHDLYIDLSLTYSRLNPPMYASREFDQGITNGAEWYCVFGGLQDYTYVYNDVLHITFELSTIKYPDASTLAGFWEDNREAMIAYMYKIHQNVKGKIVDSNNNPLDAEIQITNVSKGPESMVKTTSKSGYYFRVLSPGTYSVTASVPGYKSVSKVVRVEKDATTVLDFTL